MALATAEVAVLAVQQQQQVNSGALQCALALCTPAEHFA
jgi:hypothetical protein